MKVLIDADILVYRCGFAAQRTLHKVYLKDNKELGPIEIFDKKQALKDYLNGEHEDLEIEKEVEPEPLANCLHSVKVQIQSILRATKADSYQLYLTGKGNFRFDVATIQPYKGNRDPDHKPFWYKEIKEYLIKYWDAEVVKGMEADDAMSIAQYKNILLGNEQEGFHTRREREEFQNTIICTIDKDLNMCEGWHYNFVHDKTYWVDEIEGMRFFYKQMLSGDTSDHIPGLFKLTGQRCTKKILASLDEIEDEREMHKYVYNIYIKYGLGDKAFSITNDAIIDTYSYISVENVLTEIGQLLYMLREPGKMWRIPSE